MSRFPTNPFENIKDSMKKAPVNIDIDTLKQKASEAGATLNEKAEDIKSSAKAAKDDIQAKVTELDRMLTQATTEYNEAYTLMNDKGIKLYVERCRATDTIDFVAHLINSIANHPKEFDTAFEAIETNREKFTEVCEYADRELAAARKAAGDAGAGLAAGASVAMMGPTAAMWVATTFGSASTGAAISTLSGAAASNAALAWLGGGALTAGGGGMAAGNALLALAGPIGWTIAGATLLTSILLFANKKVKLNKEKNAEIESVKKNTEAVKEMDVKIAVLLEQTEKTRKSLNTAYQNCLDLYGKSYLDFNEIQKQSLGALVNNTKALSALFEKTVTQ